MPRKLQISLDSLNLSQQKLQHVHGPLLVLAGPGSGKTRVVTRRVAISSHKAFQLTKSLL